MAADRLRDCDNDEGSDEDACADPCDPLEAQPNLSVGELLHCLWYERV